MKKMSRVKNTIRIYSFIRSVPFQAKWWNQSESPAASAANADMSPWTEFTQSQVADVVMG